MAFFEHERRKKVLQEGKTARKYIKMLVISFTVVLLAVELLFYWLMRSILRTLEFNLHNSYIIGLGAAMMIIIFILIAIIGLINIMFTHRFFGPINRLTSELKAMDKANKYRALEIRKTDDLCDVTEEINKLIGKINS